MIKTKYLQRIPWREKISKERIYGLYEGRKLMDYGNKAKMQKYVQKKARHVL